VKGVVLAGGLGTRLLPLTRITNKHLLPVYDRPMIYYPIQTLVDAGIRDVMVVTGGNNAGDFLRLLRNGQDFGLEHMHYAYQEGEGGIAEALGLAENFVKKDRVVVMLGDNILQDGIRKAVRSFARQRRGAKVMLREVDNPKEYGVAEIEGRRIRRIVEKPKRPKSNLAVIGVYMYDHTVFDVIRRIKPSRRGELEITDVNNHYVRGGAMTYEVVEGFWGDAGVSVEQLYRLTQEVISWRSP